jgi:hypothetical protein
MIRLWHDDVRPPPDDSWTWARTNDAAKAVLEAHPVCEISLDHDLGYAGPPPGKCERCNGTGRLSNSGERKDDPTFPSDPRGVPCAVCDGDGFIGGDVLYVAGTADETGYDLVKWMCETGNVPPKITIHSWNPAGARRMAALFADHDHGCIVRPYELR